MFRSILHLKVVALLLRTTVGIVLFQASLASLSSARAVAQSALPQLQVQADPQTKVYGTSDPVFTFRYLGFISGDTASVLSGQPALGAPQKVQNLWQFTEDPAAHPYSPWLFHTDGTSRQWNGIQLSHVVSDGNFYSSLSSSIHSLPLPFVYPGMQYLLSFYAASNSPSNQLYWHRYLLPQPSQGWGPANIGSNPERVVFRCAGTADRTLDCGNDPTIPLGMGTGSDRIYWLFLGNNDAFWDRSAAGFQESGPADLYIGGFQIEPANAEKRGVVAMGDSLTQYDCTAVDPAGCTSWTVFASSLLNVPIYNRGVGGQKCDQVLARWPTDASPILKANASYAIIACGTNDIKARLSDVQIEQSISSMADLAKADGAIPVIATIGPWSLTFSNDSAEATRRSVNAWIRATFPFVLDFDAINADPSNPRLQYPAYVGDGVHLNLAGRIAEGTYVAQALAGNTLGYPNIWNFNPPMPYQPVMGQNLSNGMDFKSGVQREVGSYIVLPSIGTLIADRYQFFFSSNVLTVTPAPLLVTANDKSITFGDPIPNLDGTVSGALPADGISVRFTTTATAFSAPGKFTITPALIDPQHRLSNYSITQKLGTFTILPARCAPPVFSVPAGAFHAAQLVTITDSTPGAIIYYTTDGGLPTTQSAPYVGPVAVSSTQTLQAIALAPDYLLSNLASATYTFVPLPAIQSLSPPITTAGTGAFTLTVSGSDFDQKATVYWAGRPLVTQFVGSTSLSAQVPASYTRQSGIAAITVLTPIAGGGSSNAFKLEIDSRAGSAYVPVFKTSAATIAAGSTATYPVTFGLAGSNVTAFCLNLPANATCSYLSSAGTVTIATSPATPAGNYQIVVVFTETLTGAAPAWLFFMPSLIFFATSGKDRSAGRLFLVFIAIVASTAFVAMAGCGGGGTSPSQLPQSYQVTSSAVVTLSVQ